MAIDVLQIWKDELANLPKVGDNSWVTNFSTWYADRIVNIEPDPSFLVPIGFIFTFAKPVFETQLLTLTPTNDQVAGITGFANAWEAALLASTIVIAPGTYIPPATPATTFSIVASSIIDLTSIALGKAKLLELVTAPPVADAQNSLFPVKFREATLLLTITVSGTNSVSPPAGPNPLIATNVPLI